MRIRLRMAPRKKPDGPTVADNPASPNKGVRPKKRARSAASIRSNNVKNKFESQFKRTLHCPEWMTEFTHDVDELDKATRFTQKQKDAGLQEPRLEMIHMEHERGHESHSRILGTPFDPQKLRSIPQDNLELRFSELVDAESTYR